MWHPPTLRSALLLLLYALTANPHSPHPVSIITIPKPNNAATIASRFADGIAAVIVSFPFSPLLKSSNLTPSNSNARLAFILIISTSSGFGSLTAVFSLIFFPFCEGLSLAFSEPYNAVIVLKYQVGICNYLSNNSHRAISSPDWELSTHSSVQRETLFLGSHPRSAAIS